MWITGQESEVGTMTPTLLPGNTWEEELGPLGFTLVTEKVSEIVLDNF